MHLPCLTQKKEGGEGVHVKWYHYPILKKIIMNSTASTHSLEIGSSHLMQLWNCSEIQSSFSSWRLECESPSFCNLCLFKSILDFCLQSLEDLEEVKWDKLSSGINWNVVFWGKYIVHKITTDCRFTPIVVSQSHLVSLKWWYCSLINSLLYLLMGSGIKNSKLNYSD